MVNNDPLIEIPDQPKPRVPDSALEKISPPNPEQELQVHENMVRQAELQRKQYDLHVEQIMLKQRKLYASLLFCLSIAWLSAIGLFLFLAGLGKLRVADSVLIALITTTTANVLGLFYIVARWLFPNRNNQDKDSAKTD